MKQYSVALGVLGSAAKLSERDQGHSGQSDYYKTLLWLLSEPSIKHILLFSYSDLSKEKDHLKEIDPNGKIKSVFDVGFKKASLGKEQISKLYHLQKIVDSVKDLSKENLGDAFPDFGIFFTSQGMMTASVFPGYLNTIRFERRAAVLAMTANYASPLFVWLNMFNIPWFLLATDPRYLRKNLYPREVSNAPIKILSQAYQKHEWERLQSFDAFNLENRGITKKESNWESFYEGIEKIDLIGVTLNEKDMYNKDIRFSIISKQVESDNTPIEKDFRYNELNNWIVLPDSENTSSIYGYWHESRKQGRPQFKGYIKSSDELYDIMRRTKYTLVLPTRDGWATSKPWIVASRGTIPFIHPLYDIQKNQPLPEFLRVSTPEEMYHKMNLLDKDEILRISILKDLYKQMADGPNGEFLKNKINQTFKEKGIQINL